MTGTGRPLLPLPGVDELQLTEAELAGITGATQTRLQVEWLQANGWVYVLTRSRRPVVGRLYANLKLAGVELAGLIGPVEWSPDWSAIGG